MRSALIFLTMTVATPLAAETLEFSPPEGFVSIYASETDALTLREYAQAGQTVDDWTDAITVAELRGTGESAVDYVARVSDDLRVSCSQSFHMNPDVFETGGRQSTMSMHACPNLDATGRSEVNLLRVIEGRDGTLFAVQRSWTTSPEGPEILKWSDWIRALQVCEGDDCS